MTTATLDKGKARQTPEDTVAEEYEENYASSSSDSESDSDSDTSTSECSDAEEEVTQEFIDSLLHLARQNAQKSSHTSKEIVTLEEQDVIQLEKDDDNKEPPLPSLNPGSLPKPYIELAPSRSTGLSKVRDLGAEQVEKASGSTVPSAPFPSPSTLPAGKPLTKKERKALKNKTAGPSWFDLPAPTEAELPKLYREVEALRLRNQLDPKRFYRKEEGEGKGVKGLPKYFAIGTVVSESSPFGKASSDNLSKAQRKRTLVDELVDDAEAKSYAKKKFKELQTVRGARGRGTLAQRQAKRKPKW